MNGLKDLYATIFTVNNMYALILRSGASKGHITTRTMVLFDEDIKEDAMGDLNEDTIKSEQDIQDTNKATEDNIDTEKKPPVNSKKSKILVLVLAVLVVAGIAGYFGTGNMRSYNSAKKLMESGDYKAASQAFANLGDYKDAKDQLKECKYLSAMKLMESGDYEAASKAFSNLENYKDAEDQLKECNYLWAKKLLESNEYESAETLLESQRDYKDSEDLFAQCKYGKAKKAFDAGDYERAINGLNKSNIEKKEARTLYFDAWHKWVNQKTEGKKCIDAYSTIEETANAGWLKREECQIVYYWIGEGFSKNKQYAAAGLAYAKAGDYKDASQKCRSSWDKGAFRNTACITDYTAMGIKPDGTVVSAINTELIDSVENVQARLNRASTKIKTEGWTDMVSVLCNAYHYVGVNSKGQVKFGKTGCTVWMPGEINAPKWTDIVSIDMSFGVLVGLTKDGKVLITGEDKEQFKNAENWENIVQISVSNDVLTGVDIYGQIHLINTESSEDYDEEDDEEDYDEDYDEDDYDEEDYDEDEEGEEVFTESELQEENIVQFAGRGDYFGVYVTKDGEFHTTCTPERADWFGLEYDDYKGFGSSGGKFVSCDAYGELYIGLTSKGTVRVGGHMASLFEKSFGIKKWKNIKEAHLGIPGNPVVYGITTDGTIRLSGYEGGLYIPYHDRIRAWGKLKTPTIE